MLSLVLEGLDCQVLTAGNGIEALTVYRPYRPDLVLLDVMMPVMDSFTFYRSLAMQLERLPW